ncbi:MAG: hypothetical protein WBG35_18745, partial [Acidobacteriaceae bacterium]
RNLLLSMSGETGFCQEERTAAFPVPRSLLDATPRCMEKSRSRGQRPKDVEPAEVSEGFPPFKSIPVQ